MFLDEFVREIFTSLNGLINTTRRITAWSRVLVGLSDDEKMELVYETIDSVATTAMNAPYAIRSRFYFAVARLSHQANKFTMGNLWVDDLRLDGEIINQDAHDKANGWNNWRKLNRKLDLTAGKKFKLATDDFSNKYNHRFSPHFELGLSETVKRIPSHALPTAVREAKGVRFAQPRIEAAGMNQRHPAHGPDRKDQPVLRNERIPHPLPGSGLPANRQKGDSLAKYAVAFFKMSRSSVTRAKSRLRRRI